MYLALLDAVSVGNAETGRKFSAFFVIQRALMHSFGLCFVFNCKYPVTVIYLL